ncbi:hypothetical protein, partial [Corallibacter sp.]|uniref:hypothetical protein n=1 Tax=Corallibacter sp. TaxID=2038084 RepID=UPI003AB614E8
MRKTFKEKLLLGLVLALVTLGYSQAPLEGSPSLWGNKNQISNIGFDFSGSPVGKSRSFYNSLGKADQSQSWDILTDKIWASQVLYDKHGRGAFQTLSAPIGHYFGYSSNFLLNEDNNSYSTNDFDININNPDQVGSNAHLKKYYSINNTDNPYQDITNYPFSRTVYSTLNPRAALKVLGGNKINGQWKQSYSFTMPSGTELLAPEAFGSGFNTDTRVTKTVVRDVNGVDTVVFSDSDGNTLAAARSGNEEGTIASYSNTLQIGEQGYIDIHIPQGVSSFNVSNPDPSISGPLKVYNLITETTLSPITGASVTRTVPSGFYRIAVSNPLAYQESESGLITVTHSVNYYDYSLNYYDKAQRLVSSKQPLNHLESTFEYNSLGQLLETSSPDEGTAKFLYRKDGQIRFSQNSKQAITREVSYTNYDSYGRPIESGVFTHADSFETLENNVDDANLPATATSIKENHYTVYDIPDNTLPDELKACGLPTKYYQQTFVASNVSKTFTKNPETTTTWYSYDVFGRVEWIIQKIPGLDCLKTIDYVYSPVNGQVLEVDYQRHDKFERFLHRYKYNSAGQLAVVMTSTNDEDFILQAEYTYNESGALERTVLADDLQGIDYVYNLNGQLKAINHPSLHAENDPGHDGENGVIGDVFGLAIDYYNGDYTRPDTPTPVAQQNIHGTNQYNGNIKGLRFNTKGFEPEDDFSTYMYTYNKNNWLQSADFGTGSTTPISGGRHQVNFSADVNEDYRVSNLNYDANGNIQSLKRNGYTTSSATNAMDDFNYHYDSANKLQRIEDTGDNPNPNLYNDLKDQSNNGNVNYFYNNIGQLTIDIESKMLYEYNASGLVTRVHTFSESPGQGGDEYLLYTQDFNAVTDAEAQSWTLDSGTATINYSGIYDLSGKVCASLGTQYGSSLQLSLDGNKVASKYFDVVPNAGHVLDLDVIAYQNPFAVGYKVTVYDEENHVLATNAFNGSLDEIEDFDHQEGDCTLYYDQDEQLVFTPPTGRVRFEVDAFSENDAAATTELFLDNIEIKLNIIPKLAFYYNDRGQRVRKEVYLQNMPGTDNTYYVRDASGSPMAIYHKPPGRPSPAAEIPDEHPVYGTSRLGVFYRDQADTNEGTYAYQLTDHLGNVRAVVMKDGTNALSLTNASDYFPFGSVMPKRNVEGNYRYKFQGQEKDQETG